MSGLSQPQTVCADLMNGSPFVDWPLWFLLPLKSGSSSSSRPKLTFVTSQSILRTQIKRKWETALLATQARKSLQILYLCSALLYYSLKLKNCSRTVNLSINFMWHHQNRSRSRDRHVLRNYITFFARWGSHFFLPKCKNSRLPAAAVHSRVD